MNNKITKTAHIEIGGRSFEIAFTFRSLRELERQGIALGSEGLAQAGVEGQIKLVLTLINTEYKDAHLTEDELLDGIGLYDIQAFGQKVAAIFNPEDGKTPAFPTENPGTTSGQ